MTDISHQLKTPMAALKTCFYMYLDASDADEKTEFLKRSETQLEKLEQLIASLMNISRLETAMISLTKESILLSDLLVDAVNGVYEKARRKSIEISVQETENITLHLDKHWTSEAVINVLDNAVKYSPRNSHITISIEKQLIKQEAPLLICSDLCLPDGSGLELLAEVRTCNKDTPFIIASCYEKDDYEQEALQHGVTICMDKIKSALLKDKLVEYAYKELSEEQPPTFHKLLYLHTDNSKAEVLRAAMLQKGFNLILVNSLREAKHRLLEDKEIELILCDLSLPDGTALELFHDIRRISEKFKVNNPPIKLLPFFILTASTDLATEYQYRHEGVSDYITAPVNIPELIRRILFFVE